VDSPRPALVEVSGVRLEVLDLAGDPDRLPLVLLHAGAGSVAGWRDFPQRLASATGRRLVAYSRRGHGQSDPYETQPGPAFMEKEARGPLPALLAQLGIQRCVLVGHSDGGSIAVVFAAGSPEQVAGLVLIAAHYFVEEETLEAIRAAGVRFRQSGPQPAMIRQHADPSGAFRAWHDVWLSTAFRAMDLRPQLARIHCPILVIQGADDEFSTAAQVAAVAAAASGPVSTAIVPGGHFPHSQAADATLQAIEAFLGTHDND